VPAKGCFHCDSPPTVGPGHELDDRQIDQICQLIDSPTRRRYWLLRDTDESHNMAIMIVERNGPAGKVPGSQTPCPKRKA